MRTASKRLAFALAVFLLGAASADAQVSIQINVPVFPRLVLVPNYPVYYAPSVRANYFFYDGFYWVFNVSDGYWYTSSWYNGPWVYVEPVFVPQFLLVVPYRYYPVRPAYWRGWSPDRPPRWGDHWGRDWEGRRRGWDRWDRSRHYEAAPLPLYQRRYERDRYPTPARQRAIFDREYHYRPHDDGVRRQQPTIVERQEHGGTRAPGRAYRAGQSPAERETAQRPRVERERQPVRAAPERRREIDTHRAPQEPRSARPAPERAPQRAPERRAEPHSAPPPHQEAPPHRERSENVQPHRDKTQKDSSQDQSQDHDDRGGHGSR
jgi:hypothetical protein